MKVSLELWLDTYYPEDGTCVLEGGMDGNYGKKREEVKTLYLTINANGKVKLPGFTNLEVLEADCEWFSEIDLSDCPNLKTLYIAEGSFDKINLDKNTELTEIKIKKWKTKIDLNIFSHLKKIETLNLEESKFVGSLEFLKDCKELNYLNIRDNLDISEGLEYLPKSLKFEREQFSGSGVDEILEPFNYNFAIWKTDYEKKNSQK